VTAENIGVIGHWTEVVTLLTYDLQVSKQCNKIPYFRSRQKTEQNSSVKLDCCVEQHRLEASECLLRRRDGERTIELSKRRRRRRPRGVELEGAVPSYASIADLPEVPLCGHLRRPVLDAARDSVPLLRTTVIGTPLRGVLVDGLLLTMKRLSSLLLST
jgi:hypothetical protein